MSGCDVTLEAVWGLRGNGAGLDPKTLLCAFFKAGTCEKGSKCKFSHDLDVGRKQEKRDLYADARDEKLEGEPCWSSVNRTEIDGAVWADTMDKWDEEKLRSVVTSKAGNPRTTTDVCRSSRFSP